MWLTPPAQKICTTRLAFGGKCGSCGRTAEPTDTAVTAFAARASRSNIHARAMPPMPPAAVHRKCRRGMTGAVGPALPKSGVVKFAIMVRWRFVIFRIFSQSAAEGKRGFAGELVHPRLHIPEL